MNLARSAAFAGVLVAAFSPTNLAIAEDRHPDAPPSRAMAGQSTAPDEPLLLPDEIALIERRCGDAPDTEGGESIILSDGILICGDGRRIDDPEVRAMVAVLSPRISSRLQRLSALSALSNGSLERALGAVRDFSSLRERR